MIESRYKIEYAIPEAIQNKSNKYRFVKYVFLTLLVLLLVGAYFFGLNFNKFPNNTADMIQQIKNSFLVESSEQIISKSESGLSATNTTAQPEASPNISKAITELLNLPEDVVIEPKIDITENSGITNTSYTDNPINETIKSQSLEKIKVLSEKNKQHLKTSKKQLASNALLTKSLNDLSKQLMDEVNKNKVLNDQLTKQNADKDMLTELLNDALSNASSEDKQYISSLNEMENQESPANTESSEKEKIIESSAKAEIAKVVLKKEDSIDYNNSINLSTTSQIDAIVAAMKGINTNPTKSRPIRPKSISLHVKLQNQINALINDNGAKTNIVYTKALEKESQVRNNEVRSIIVKKGETLWGIALRAYGNGNDYKKIIKANPQLSNRSLITAGQILRVPI